MLDRGDSRCRTCTVLALVVLATVVGVGWQVGWLPTSVSSSDDAHDVITSNYLSFAQRHAASSHESQTLAETSVGGAVASSHATDSNVIDTLRSEFDKVLAEAQRLVVIEGFADTIRVILGSEGERVDCLTPLPSFEGGILGRDASFVVRCPDGPTVFIDIGIYDRAASRYGSRGATDLLRMLFAHEIAHILMWSDQEIATPFSGESDVEKRADCFAVWLLLQEQDAIDWRMIASVLRREVGPEACR